MDTRPIGVFDSGLGGLTAVKELHRILPNENIVYLGDTARAPYGTRSDEKIIKYAKEDASFLLTKDVKAILIACGTVSSTALPEIMAMTDIPVVGVINEASNIAVESTENSRILVMATPATIRSHSYVKKIQKLDESIQCVELGCPLLVSLVENGYIEPDNSTLNDVIHDYLKDVSSFNADTIILGCTHFPIIKKAISKHTPGAELVESGKVAAYDLKRTLMTANLENPEGKGQINIYLTEMTGNTEKVINIFLNDTPIHQIEITEL